MRRSGIDATTREPIYEPYTPPILGKTATASPREFVLGEISPELLDRLAPGET